MKQKIIDFTIDFLIKHGEETGEGTLMEFGFPFFKLVYSTDIDAEWVVRECLFLYFFKKYLYIYEDSLFMEDFEKIREI